MLTTVRPSLLATFATVALLIGCDAPSTTPDAPSPADVPAAVDSPPGEDAGLADAPATSDVPATPDAPPAPDLAILVVGDLDPAAFPATSFRAFLDAHGTVTELADPSIDDDTVLDDVDLLVFGHLPRPLSTGERTAFSTWAYIESGRAIVIGGYNTTSRAEVHSVLVPLGIVIDQERTTFPSDPTTFVVGAVSRGSLTMPPPIGGAFTIDSIGLGAALEIRTTAGDDVAARWEAESSDGRVFVMTDDHPTLDANWSDDVADFWGNVMTFLFPSES